MINSCAGLVLEEAADLKEAEKQFRAAVLAYYSEAKAQGCVKYNKVHAVLTAIPGVLDFEHFYMDQDVENIPLEPMEYPETGDITFTKAGVIA